MFEDGTTHGVLIFFPASRIKITTFITERRHAQEILAVNQKALRI
jgi:hypothetical protein